MVPLQSQRSRPRACFTSRRALHLFFIGRNAAEDVAICVFLFLLTLLQIHVYTTELLPQFQFLIADYTSTSTSDMSSVTGPSRHAATRSRMPFLISRIGSSEVSRTMLWIPSIPSISPRESKTSVIPSV